MHLQAHTPRAPFFAIVEGTLEHSVEVVVHRVGIHRSSSNSLHVLSATTDKRRMSLLEAGEPTRAALEGLDLHGLRKLSRILAYLAYRKEEVR